MRDDATVIHVSPAGSDSASGAQAETGRDGPVQTLERARTLARQALARGDHAVTVRLRGGHYPRTHPLTLTSDDGGGLHQQVTWQAYANEQPVLSAAQPVTGWQRVTQIDDAPAGTPPQAIGRLWMAELPASPTNPTEPWRFRCLFDGAGLLTRAAVTGLPDDAERRDQASATGLAFPPQRWPSFADVEGAEVALCTARFAYNRLPITSIDYETGWLQSDVPGTYRLRAPHLPGSDPLAQTVAIENVAEGLTEPGRWMLDGRRNRLYVWPRAADATEPADILAPSGCELLRIEGDFQQARWVRNLCIEGLTFRHGDRMIMRRDRPALQHDWEWLDEANALIRLCGTERVHVRHCTAADAGGGGIRLDLHATDNRIERNTLRDLGGTGIVLAGYGPGTRDEHRLNVVAHNEICRIGQSFKACSGIFISQSADNHIHDNRLHELPYNGITLSGIRTHTFDPDAEASQAFEGARTIDWQAMRDVPLQWPHHLGFLHSRYNIIEHNEVTRVMLALGDGNGIYLSGTGVGNDVVRNYVHDLPGEGTQSAIRTDGWQWFTRVRENVVWRVNGGGLTVKQINEYENNIIVECRRFGAICARRSPGSSAHGATVRRNVIVQPHRDIEDSGPFSPFYEQRGHSANRPAQLQDLVIDDNLMWCPADPEAAQQCLDRVRHELGKDTRSMAADPGFIDMTSGDFRLHDAAAVWEIGFRPIPAWGPRTAGGNDRHGNAPDDRYAKANKSQHDTTRGQSEEKPTR